MSVTLTIHVVGTKKAVANIRASQARVHARVLHAVRRLGIDVQRGVKNEMLTGQALNVRSGRLRRSITQVTTDEGTTIRSRTGTNVVYGRFWEYGFHGVVPVRDHTRKVRWGRRLSAQGIAHVAAHMRTIDQDPRPFLRPALQSRAAYIREAIAAAVAGKKGEP